jgi:hypothetical protein
MGYVVMENRGGLVVAASTTPATGTAERKAAEAMVGGLAPHRTRPRTTAAAAPPSTAAPRATPAIG